MYSMSFRNWTGQEQVKRFLQSGLRIGKSSHAYVFAGPVGTGKQKAASLFAKALLCNESEDDACGECLNCRKVEHGNHPHLMKIDPDGASIKIDQIRSLQRQFAYRTESNNQQIYIIHQADRMTIQAANSLLKFLEEPQANVTAILVTDNGQAILPTIRSRTQWISFLPMMPSEMAETLIAEGLPPALVLSAVHLTSGLDAARDMIELNGFAEIRNGMIQLGKACLTRNQSIVVAAHQHLVKANLLEHADLLLQFFVLWFKDLIQLQFQYRDQVVFIDELDLLASQAFSKDQAYWVTCMEQAIETRKRLRFNANPQLAMEQFLLNVQGG
jgi:DNA polymerase-3 subunit delta'